MKSFKGKTLRWEWREGVIELTLDHAPANEIGMAVLEELERFVASFGAFELDTAACIISSARKQGFSAGADLRQLYHRASSLAEKQRLAELRSYPERIHAGLEAV